MELQKINVKFYLETDELPLAAFIPVFHAWIQATDGEYHDVADYSHVQHGPGVILVSHEANVSIDEDGGRRGLLYNRKQPLPGSNRHKLRGAFRAALAHCRKIEGEPLLEPGLRFRGDEALVTINDRLRAPNTGATYAALVPELEALGRALFAGQGFRLRHVDDPEQRFAVTMTSDAGFDVAGLLRNLDRERDSGSTGTARE